MRLPLALALHTDVTAQLQVSPGSWKRKRDGRALITPGCSPFKLGGNEQNRTVCVIKVTDSWPASHEFEPSTTEDPACRRVMYVKSVESSNVLPLLWCGS
ncbi:hypothetical protein TNCV_227631 [Trichonephila clavipes]|nr:hypothetical protein TNCV_227631 [Trichonephila clavipes]